MRGITGWGVHLPYRRLDRSAIRAVAGSGGGSGTRTVAGYDEDTTTMGAEAARAALRRRTDGVGTLWFATAEPAYLDRTNATVLHAVLRLGRTVPAYDALGSVRSAMGALRAALSCAGSSLVVASDLRTGLPGGPDEASGGDGAAALLVGGAEPAGRGGAGLGTDGPGYVGPPVLAEVLAWESVTEEFLDRWRTPGARASRVWEERFGAGRYTEVGLEAIKLALAGSGLAADDVDHLVVAGLDDRASAAVARRSGVPEERLADRLGATVGNTGAAQPALLLAATLETARPGEHVLLLSLADGADAVLLRTTEALAGYRPDRPVAAQVATGAPVSYGRYLHWRGLLPVEPPRRPEPGRVSSPAAHRNAEWKYAFAGGTGSGGAAGVHAPPAPGDGGRTPMADVRGTVVTFTVDRLSYSLSPPIVFAVVDFDGGGRLPVELTDLEAEAVAIGDRVEMTFRRLATTDGIHNYFWKARPSRGN